MNNATTGLRQAAVTHLDLFRKERSASDARRAMSDRYWIELTYSYGLTADDIAEHSGLSLEHVRDILRGE